MTTRGWPAGCEWLWGRASGQAEGLRGRMKFRGVQRKKPGGGRKTVGSRGVGSSAGDVSDKLTRIKFFRHFTWSMNLSHQHHISPHAL
jgi:hypothetical protein